MRVLFAIVLLFLAPLTVFASSTTEEERAGTDIYLRNEAGFTEADLSTKLVTEKRKAFPLAHEADAVNDPIGDVLSRYGTSSGMNVAWGDLERVSAEKNSDGSWTFHVVAATDIPEILSHQAQLLLLVDRDGNADNNDLAGIHGGVDAEFAVERTVNGWNTDFRWYNKEADFWAVDKETLASFTREKNAFSLTIPAEELPNGASSWRVVLALANGSDTQIDAAPGIGFPKPLGTEETPTNAQTTKPSIALYGIPFVLIGLGLIWFGWKRRT